MTSNNCPVNSKTYKRNNKFLLVREVQENSKTAVCGAIENGSFQSQHKKSLGLRLLWFCNCFVPGSNIYLVDFYDTYVNDIWLFQNKYLVP